MDTVRLTVSPAFTVGETDPRLFGSFIEHIGRAVYGGIYEPTHPTADAEGFRGDVSETIRELKVSTIRYPGGNFVSGYCWEDGIGPKEKRPRRVDLAWRSVETNQCGTDDFAQYCKRNGIMPLMAVNLGTAGIDEARHLVEYCNHPSGTYYSDLRIRNGYPEPHAIKTWCLGNEMDSIYQIGHKEAQEYGRLAAEAAKAMKCVDLSIETVLCGSSTPEFATFPAWEETVLDHAYEYVDYISLHRYYNDDGKDLATYLASPVDAERYIETVVHVCDVVKAKKRTDKTIMLSFDEWNVWRHTCDYSAEPWEIAPPILEETYRMVDALVVGGMLITLLRHCDRVKIACLAQLVNVIAPIMTKNGGGLWKQTIFYPFRDVSVHGRGTVYDVRIETPTYDCEYGAVGVVDAIAVKNGEGETVIFAVNRSAQAAELCCDLSAFGVTSATHTALSADALSESNTAEDPERVKPHLCEEPRIEQGRLSCRLEVFSWNVIMTR